MRYGRSSAAAEIARLRSPVAENPAEIDGRGCPHGKGQCLAGRGQNRALARQCQAARQAAHGAGVIGPADLELPLVIVMIATMGLIQVD